MIVRIPLHTSAWSSATNNRKVSMSLPSADLNMHGQGQPSLRMRNLLFLWRLTQQAGAPYESAANKLSSIFYIEPVSSPIPQTPYNRSLSELGHPQYGSSDHLRGTQFCARKRELGPLLLSRALLQSWRRTAQRSENKPENTVRTGSVVYPKTKLRLAAA